MLLVERTGFRGGDLEGFKGPFGGWKTFLVSCFSLTREDCDNLSGFLFGFGANDCHCEGRDGGFSNVPHNLQGSHVTLTPKISNLQTGGFASKYTSTSEGFLSICNSLATS